MKIWSFLFCLCALIGSAFSVQAQEKPPVDLSSPDTTVLSFVASLNRFDFKNAARCVVDANPRSPELLLLQQQVESGKPVFEFSNLKVDIQGEHANCRSNVVITSGGKIEARFISNLPLVAQNAGWKIAPFDRHVVEQEQLPEDLLRLVATLVFVPDAEAFQDNEERCRANLGHLINAYMEFGTEHQEELDPVRWKKLLMSYVKQEAVFHCPNDPSETMSYSYNVNLSVPHKHESLFNSRTILFYEGKNGKLDFRHNGRARVALTDATVVEVNAEEARSLKWKLDTPR